jgi:ATP-dependent Lon protease
MRDYRDAKAMARRLREALAQRGLALTHTDCLELIARSFGLKDWQVLAALIETDRSDGAAPADPATWSGPVLLLRDVVAFPKLTMPVFVGRAMSKLALANAYAGEQEVLLVTQRDRADDDPAPEAIYPVGVVADVLERTVLQAGEVKLLVRGRQRATVLGLALEDGFRRAEARLEPAAPAHGPAAEAMVGSSIAALQRYAAQDNTISPDVAARLAEIRSPGVLADLIAAHAKLPIADKQRVLETRDPVRRLQIVVRLISDQAAEAA